MMSALNKSEGCLIAALALLKIATEKAA